MRHKESYSIYPVKAAEHISLLKYSKSSCGVDFLLNTAESSEKPGWFNIDKRYKTDFFEFYFFRRAEGYMLLSGRKIELHNPVANSYHMIVACLYQFLLLLNRFYAGHFNLPFAPPQNNYAYQYKELLEKHISEKTHVSDYAEMMNVSRVTLNKAVVREFGLSAVHLLKQRLLQEVKNDILFSGMSVKEIAYRLHFSEPNHLMRFFKQMTGQTISEFVASIKSI